MTSRAPLLIPSLGFFFHTDNSRPRLLCSLSEDFTPSSPPFSPIQTFHCWSKSLACFYPLLHPRRPIVLWFFMSGILGDPPRLSSPESPRSRFDPKAVFLLTLLVVCPRWLIPLLFLVWRAFPHYIPLHASP